MTMEEYLVSKGLKNHNDCLTVNHLCIVALVEILNLKQSETGLTSLNEEHILLRDRLAVSLFERKVLFIKRGRLSLFEKDSLLTRIAKKFKY